MLRCVSKITTIMTFDCFSGQYVKKISSIIESALVSRSDNKLRWLHDDLLINGQAQKVGVCLTGFYTRNYLLQRAKKLSKELFALSKRRAVVYAEPILMASFRILSPYYVQKVLPQPPTPELRM